MRANALNKFNGEEKHEERIDQKSCLDTLGNIGADEPDSLRK
jgi:hypothetical protein